ncbi:MAG: FAD binding domain-containing protein [Thermomicrobiales bacterium]
MYPNPFDYHRAGTVAEAISLPQELGDDAKIVAGGHSLLPAMKAPRQSGSFDRHHRHSRTSIRSPTSDYIEIGALTRHVTLTKDPIIAAKAPLLAAIADEIGDRQIRARGTIGGVVAHADPAADYPAGLLALDAEVVSVGPGGETVRLIGDFLVSIFTTTLGADEVAMGDPHPGSA